MRQTKIPRRTSRRAAKGERVRLLGIDGSNSRGVCIWTMRGRTSGQISMSILTAICLKDSAATAATLMSHDELIDLNLNDSSSRRYERITHLLKGGFDSDAVSCGASAGSPFARGPFAWGSSAGGPFAPSGAESGGSESFRSKS